MCLYIIIKITEKKILKVKSNIFEWKVYTIINYNKQWIVTT